MEANDEALVSAVDCDEGEMEMQQQHENEECGENQQQHATTAAHVLDEQSLQQLMDSGSVGEDSIIAIVQNEHGEPQTVVLSRADAEALGIQFDTVERPSSSLQVCHEGGNEEEEMLLQGDGLQHQHPNGDEMQEDLEMLQGQNGVTEGDSNNQQQQQQVELEEDQEDEGREAEQQPQLMDQESVQHISLTPPVIVNEAAATTLSLPFSSVAANSNTTTITRSLDAASLTRLGSSGGGTSKTTIVSCGSSSGTTTITLQEAAAATGVGSSSSATGSSSSNDMLSNIIHSLFQSNANSGGNNMSTAAANELLNQTNSGNASVSIVPRMVGGKRKLCLRLPASTASALLAQTSSGGGGGSGSTFSVQGAGGILGSAASSSSGGIPKRIKIVIPPGSSISGVQAELQQQIKMQQQHQQQRVMKVAMHSTAANKTVTSAASPTITKSSAAAAAISGPARFVVESSSDMSSPTASPSVSSIVTTMKSSPIAKSSASTKPFLASLFNATSTTTVTPVNSSSSNAQSSAAAVKKSSSNLGSTENPIQLVQEGNSFRSLQPLTPDQLKHIASVLKQNKQAIQEGVKIGGGSSPVASPSSSTSSSAAVDNKRRVVYDAATNTRIVYRVVTPGELTKGGGGGASPSGAGHLQSPKQSSAVGQKILTSSSPLSSKAAVANSSFAVATMTSTPSARGRGGRGRGRPPGRPPRTSHYINQQQQQLRKGQRGQVSSDSDDDDDDLADEDFRLPASHNSSLSHHGDMSREEREGRKKLLPRTRSGRVSKPPRHMVKDYKRLHHLDFAQPDLDDSDGGYSDYRVDAKAKCKSEVDGDEEDDVDDVGSTGEDEDSAAALKPSVLGLRATASRSSLGGGSALRKSSPIPTSPFHCTTCKKEYTTPNRLSRHLEQFPDHSSSIDLDVSTVKTEATSPKKSTSNGKETANESLDGTVEDDDDVSLVQASSPVKAVTAGRGGRCGWRGGARGRGRGRGRGRPGRPPQPHSPALLSEKRKVKLAEALEMCGDDEVVDVAGPRLSAVMSTWEYVLLRVQQEEEGNSSAPLIPRILNEVTALVSKVSAMAARHLHVHQTSITDQSQSGQQQQQQLEPYLLSNAQTARIIGLQCGTYFISKDDRKLLTTEQDACSAGISTDAAVDEEETGRSIVADEAASMSTQVVTESAAAATTTTTISSTDVMLVKSDPGSLWEELEEASSHLTVSADDHLMTSGAAAAARVGSVGSNGGGGGSSSSLLLLSTGDGHVGPHSSSSSGGGGDPLGGVGEDDDDELMQVENVDDIVNQAVEVSQTGGSQAPSPL